MSLNPEHLLVHVIRPVLHSLNLHSTSAERLVLGTAAQESKLKYLHQLGSGPAIGLWQIEPFTARDIMERVAPNPKFKRVMDLLLLPIGSVPEYRMGLEGQLHGNLYLGAAICRLKYYASPFTFTGKETLSDLANIWKTYYNTRLGKGKPEEFIQSWHQIIDRRGF